MSEKKDKSKIDNEANNEDKKVVETEKISDEDPNNVNIDELNESDNNNTNLENQIKDLKDKYVKLIVVNKKDLYMFDKFVDQVLTESKAHDVKIIEDFSDLKAENVKNEIIENAQDTVTLLDSYVDELDVNNLDKNRLKTMLKGLYVEASNMEI